MTAYTALRVVEDGVLFYEQQAARLARAGGEDAARAFKRFAAEAAPGAWSLCWDGRDLAACALAGSRLFDGMPAVLRPSPLTPGSPPLEKAPPPGPYGPLRVDGISVLLASQEGGELWESCSAAVLAHDGRGLVRVPDDRPRVRSVAEAHLTRALGLRPAPVPAASRAIVLVNAVKGVCVLEPSRSGSFPASALADIHAAIAASVRRR